MPISVVTSGKDPRVNSDGTVCSVVLTPQAGDCIVAGGHIEGAQTLTIADGVNTYATALDKLHTGSGVRVQLTYALNCAAGSTTVTMTPSALYYRCFYAALLRNVKTSSAEEDRDSAEAAAGTQNIVGPTVTAIGSGIVVAMMATTGGVTVAPLNSFVEIQEQESSAYSSGAFAYILSSAGNYTPSWSRVNTGINVSAAIVLGESVDFLSLNLAEPVIGTSFF